MTQEKHLSEWSQRGARVCERLHAALAMKTRIQLRSYQGGPVGTTAELENERVSLRHADLWNRAKGVNPYYSPTDPGGLVNISERSAWGAPNHAKTAWKAPGGQPASRYQAVHHTSTGGRMR